jgi:amino acid adenylation domain-containing protein
MAKTREVNNHHLAVRDLFDYPTIRDLAAYIDNFEQNDGANTASSIPDRIPMSTDTMPSQAMTNASLTLHDLFLAQVSRRTSKPAVLTANKALTYRDLDELSLGLAKAMRGIGLVSEGRIAVAMHKGWEQVVAMMAVVRAGGAYVPIDMSLPVKRRVDEFKRDDAAHTSQAVNWTVNSGNLAAVIYTSGTTGVPKGVLLEHAGLVNTIQVTNDRYDVGPNDRALALTSIHHDLSIFDVFGMLAAGGAVVVPDERLRRDPSHWLSLIKRHRVSVWNSVPATLAMMMEYNRGIAESLPSSLRLLFLGGDWIPVTMPDAIRSESPHAEIVSIGGPTEGSLWSTVFDIETVDPKWKSIPYGTAIPGTSCIIVNDQLEDVAAGEIGELCLSGVCLARGYLNDQAKTDAAFLRHPRNGERIYRTGDLGRLMEDGNIELIGRADFQINIDGYRIELQEIEAVLVKHDAISAAVVTAPRDEMNRPSLTAHLVCVSPLETETLKVYLRHELPAQMVPGLFHRHDALPLTPNGKVDRQALEQIGESLQTTDVAARVSVMTNPLNPEVVGEPKGSVAPKDVRKTVNSIWRELLKLDLDVASEADFFDLGGHSLLALMFISRVREQLGIELSVTTIFDHPTFGDLCGIVESLEHKDDSSAERDKSEPGESPDDQIEIRI